MVTLELFYLRTKEKQEIDFLIVKDKKPWLPVEVKKNDTVPSPHFRRFLPQMTCPLALQVVNPPDYRSERQMGETKLPVMSAAGARDRWFST